MTAGTLQQNRVKQHRGDRPNEQHRSHCHQTVRADQQGVRKARFPHRALNRGDDRLAPTSNHRVERGRCHVGEPNGDDGRNKQREAGEGCGNRGAQPGRRPGPGFWLHPVHRTHPRQFRQFAGLLYRGEQVLAVGHGQVAGVNGNHRNTQFRAKPRQTIPANRRIGNPVPIGHGHNHRLSDHQREQFAQVLVNRRPPHDQDDRLGIGEFRECQPRCLGIRLPENAGRVDKSQVLAAIVFARNGRSGEVSIFSESSCQSGDQPALADTFFANDNDELVTGGEDRGCHETGLSS
jgi:hypothetical protein